MIASFPFPSQAASDFRLAELFDAAINTRLAYNSAAEKFFVALAGHHPGNAKMRDLAEKVLACDGLAKIKNWSGPGR